MSKPLGRRTAQRNKQVRTHNWDAHPEFEVRMVEHGHQHVVDDVPRPGYGTFPPVGNGRRK